jgi:Lsr2
VENLVRRHQNILPSGRGRLKVEAGADGLPASRPEHKRRAQDDRLAAGERRHPDDCRAPESGMLGAERMRGDPVRCQAGVALGVAGGYLLGRSGKIKLALVLGSVAAGMQRGKLGRTLTIGPTTTAPDETSRAETPALELSNDGLPKEAVPDDPGDESDFGNRPADVAPQPRVDDDDGSEASETVFFGLDGHQYRLDLSTDDAARLRGSLAPFVAVARPRGKNSRTRRGSQPRRRLR